MQSIAQKKRRFKTYSVGKGEGGVINKIYVDDLTHDQLLDTYLLYLGDGAQHILTDEYMRDSIKDYIDGCGARNEIEALGFAFVGEGAQVFDPHLGVFVKPEMIHIGTNARIDCVGGKFEGGLGIHIGAGVHISARCHLNVGGGELFIGDNAAITSGACIITGTNTMAGQAMSSAAPKEMQVVERKTVIIGECAMVAAHAVVLPGVTIGRYAVVGAGAVVTRNVEPFAIVMGVPARIVGDRRDREGWNYA